MQTQLSLNLLDALVKTIDIQHLPAFCMRLKFALAELVTCDQQHYFRQSYSSYLAHIDLFEQLLEKELILKFQVQQSGIFMFLMLQGHAVLSNPPRNFVLELEGNSCTIQHLMPGHYQWKLQSGAHQMLILSLNSEWFIQNNPTKRHFQPLIQNFHKPVHPVFGLPRCALTSRMLRPLKKLEALSGLDDQDLEKTLHHFLSETVQRYHQQLGSGRHITAFMHEVKAREIAAYVKAHYAENTVGDVPGLASHFNVSERLFADLCKMAFQKSLHQYVIDLRMNYALLFLTTSRKSISDVAFAVGYSDPHYFRKAFKKYHHIAPKYLQGLLM